MPTQAPPRDHAEVSYEVFMGVLWTFVALSLTLVLSRVVIRFKAFNRLFWDDACVILSWLIFLASAVLYRLNMPRVYRNYEAIQGKIPYDEHAIENWDYFMHFIVPFNVLFYSSLWAVKISFLLFFAKLGNKLWHFEIWWWIVLSITMAGYVTCIADIQYECSRPAKSFIYITENCNTLERISWVMKTLYANAGVDVGSDILSLSIPFLILWNTRVLFRKKVILFSIFSATVVIMIIAITRVTIVNSTKQTAEIAWLYFWSSIEAGTAIMIACVASFRQLFVANREQPSTSKSDNSKRLLRFMQSNTKSQSADFTGSVFQARKSMSCPQRI